MTKKTKPAKPAKPRTKPATSAKPATSTTLPPALAKALSNPKGVRDLDLSGLGLTALPEDLSKLRDLQRLNLANNRLTRLPATFCDLKALVVLDVSDNALTTLDGAAHLPRLEVLNAHRNRLTTVPHGFGPRKLRELYLGGNAVVGSASTTVWTLPMMLGQVRTLEVLGLEASSLVNDYTELGALKRLTRLRISGPLPARDATALRGLLPKAKLELVASARIAPAVQTTLPPAVKPAPGAGKLTAEQAALKQRLLELAAEKACDLGEIERVIRPCIVLTTRKATKADRVIGASRLGGEPDLAPGSEWPEHDGAPMPFLVQVRLEEVTSHDREGLLPRKGLLSFFAKDLDWGHVRYEPDVKRLQPRPLPDAIEDYDRLAPWGFTITSLISIPQPGTEAAPDFDDYPDLVYDFYKEIGHTNSMHSMLGHRTDPDDPKQLPEDILLLAVDSDDKVGNNFGDSMRQYFYLNRERLAALDFSKVVVTCGV